MGQGGEIFGRAAGLRARLPASKNAGPKQPRRRDVLQLAALAAACALPGRAGAQTYPARPVRLIVATTAGATSDIVARLTAQWLTEHAGQQFIVENRPGGGNNIGTEAVVRATPDGYTLLFVNAVNAINATLFEKLGYNFTADIVPVAGIIRVPMVMQVNPAVPAKTVPEFIALAHANPGKINMASAGIGSTPHVVGELFKMMTGVNMLHVPYRGGAQAITDLLGGQVQVMFEPIAGPLDHLRSGRLRPLAVTTTARSAALPDVPTVAEFVPGYEASAWYGIGAPRGTPPEVVEALNRLVNTALADPKLQARFADLGATTLPGTPADFAKLIADETDKWGRVVKFSGAKAE
jgi:tripartite-type tricarboxylate transporter receptor subunit TctC